MCRLSGDHETLRTMRMYRSPKSVIGRKAPPVVGIVQMFVVAPSTRSVARCCPSG
jgi:hypothetical protein